MKYICLGYFDKGKHEGSRDSASGGLERNHEGKRAAAATEHYTLKNGLTETPIASPPLLVGRDAMEPGMAPTMGIAKSACVNRSQKLLDNGPRGN